MDRLACISVPALGLQIALRRLSGSVVLVADDKPTSPVLNLNRQARDQGLTVGMRYSEALVVAPEAKAAVVPEDVIQGTRREIMRLLEGWTPRIEGCPFDPGSFWADPRGLEGLFGSEVAWGMGVRRALGELGLRASVVVGTSRLGTYVLARSRRSTVISSNAEDRAVRAASLDIFPLPPRHRRLLKRLGVGTWGDLADLPASDVDARFGPSLLQEVRRLEGWSRLPLQGRPTPPVATRTRRPEVALKDHEALEAHLEEPLGELLGDAARRGRLGSLLRLVLVLEEGEPLVETLRPASPTASGVVWGRLLGLRLSALALKAGVVEIRLALDEVALPPGCEDLFAAPVVRDLRRGAEALALIRAQWGDRAALRPVLVDTHRPEESFRWEVAVDLRPPRPTSAPGTPGRAGLRRVPWVRTSGTSPAGRRLGGPWVLQTVGEPRVDREYWFLELPRGEVAWVSWEREERVSTCEGWVD